MTDTPIQCSARCFDVWGDGKKIVQLSCFDVWGDGKEIIHLRGCPVALTEKLHKQLAAAAKTAALLDEWKATQ